MIREPSVRFKESAARDIRTQRFKQPFGKEPPRTVAGINNDFKAAERFFLFCTAECGKDFFFKSVYIGRHNVNRSALAALRGNRKCGFFGGRKNCRNIGLFKPARNCGEKFHAVAFHRQMACRDHYSGIKMQFVHAAHKHCRSACKAAVISICPDGSNAVRKPDSKLFTAQS